MKLSFVRVTADFDLGACLLPESPILRGKLQPRDFGDVSTALLLTVLGYTRELNDKFWHD